MDAHRAQFAQWKRERANDDVRNALDVLARTANAKTGDANIFGSVVAAAEVGATHGEICGTLRRELRKSLCPPLIRFAAMGLPMMPRPMNPMLLIACSSSD